MKRITRPKSLNAKMLRQGIAALCDLDPDFARIHADLGVPPIWAREPGFPTLVYIILEQQVSLASAKAAFTKLQEASQTISPEIFLKFNDAELKQIGFSRQKTRYCRGLALALVNKEFDLNALEALDDDAVRSALIKINGIGPWTANIYLLMVLLRPDIWPAGDLALAVAYQKLKGLPIRPSTTELEQIALSWKPWRAVAARLLWHYYLNQ